MLPSARVSRASFTFIPNIMKQPLSVFAASGLAARRSFICPSIVLTCAAVNVTLISLPDVFAESSVLPQVKSCVCSTPLPKDISALSKLSKNIFAASLQNFLNEPRSKLAGAPPSSSLVNFTVLSVMPGNATTMSLPLQYMSAEPLLPSGVFIPTEIISVSPFTSLAVILVFPRVSATFCADSLSIEADSPSFTLSDASRVSAFPAGTTSKMLFSAPVFDTRSGKEASPTVPRPVSPVNA